MIADHVYVFFTFFGPDLVEKEEDKKVNYRLRLSNFCLQWTYPTCKVGLKFVQSWPEVCAKLA